MPIRLPWRRSSTSDAPSSPPDLAACGHGYLKTARACPKCHPDDSPTVPLVRPGGTEGDAWKRDHQPEPWELEATNPHVERTDMRHPPDTETQEPTRTPDDARAEQLSRLNTSQALDASAYRQEGREDCHHCLGTGYVLTTNDYLRRLTSRLPVNDADATDAMILHFYELLIGAAPHLADMFPADLLSPDSPSDSGGRVQRDSLLSALVAVIQTYDPDHPTSEGMQILATHLAAAGRSHYAFLRPGGKIRGAMVREYAAVIGLTIQTLRDVLGIEWRQEFEEPLDDALDFASRKMLRAQDEWLDQHPNPTPRTPRPSR